MNRLPEEKYSCNIMNSNVSSATFQKDVEIKKKNVEELLKPSKSFIFITVDDRGCFARVVIGHPHLWNSMLRLLNRHIGEIQESIKKNGGRHE